MVSVGAIKRNSAANARVARTGVICIGGGAGDGLA